MDTIFDEFRIWAKDKQVEWLDKEVIVDEIVETTDPHSIHINLHSDESFGHVGLFENNNIYWVEFEAVARDFEDFYRYFEFEKLPSFADVEQEYIEFMTLKK